MPRHRWAPFAPLALMIAAGDAHAQWQPRAAIAYNAVFSAAASARTFNRISGYFVELGTEHELRPRLGVGAGAIAMNGLIPMSQDCDLVSRCKPSGAQVRGVFAAAHTYVPSARASFLSATMGLGVFRFRSNDYRAIDAVGPGIFSSVELTSQPLWGVCDHYAADLGGTPFNVFSWTIGFRRR
jgi:hypothetical protein